MIAAKRGQPALTLNYRVRGGVSRRNIHHLDLDFNTVGNARPLCSPIFSMQYGWIHEPVAVGILRRFQRFIEGLIDAPVSYSP